MSGDALVLLSKPEQEYLLHAIEAALPLRSASDLFLWAQGPLQALLPHRIMLCLRFDVHDQLQHVECLHGTVLDAGVLGRLRHRDDGLAVRLARHCRGWNEAMLPARFDAGVGANAQADAEDASAVEVDASGDANADADADDDANADTNAGGAGRSLAAFGSELRALGLENMLLHGSGPLPGGATFFALFGLPQRPHARHAYFLELLLPYLHLALQRVGQRQARAGAATLARPVSAREAEILHWVREGKSNDEIGQILGISGLTVKNHLQRLYRLLGVSNRAHAIARGMALQLFERPPQPLARAA
jgi:transcriptional regulator EpsA